MARQVAADGPSPLMAYFIALAITLGVESAIVVAFFPGQRPRLATTCLLANVFTHGLLHFGFPRWLPAGISPLVVGEAFATLFEAAAYALVSRDAGRSLAASALANSASFGLGLVVFR